MTNQEKIIYESEMGFSHNELLRSLPSAVHPFLVNKIDNFTYRIHHHQQIALLYLSQQSSRKIASIVIPVVRIVIEFENFNQQQYDEFMNRFKRYLHKGGG